MNPLAAAYHSISIAVWFNVTFIHFDILTTVMVSFSCGLEIPEGHYQPAASNLTLSLASVSQLNTPPKFCNIQIIGIEPNAFIANYAPLPISLMGILKIFLCIYHLDEYL